MAWMTRKGNRWLVRARRWPQAGAVFGSEQEAVAFKATVEPSAIDRVIASLPADKRDFALRGTVRRRERRRGGRSPSTSRG
jgi:hypothetical protein